MNMSQEDYNKEISRQIENCQIEIQALTNDFHACTDDICKSQIKTLLEKQEYKLIDLLSRRI